MAARFISTSRLGNIIQMITLSRQTGILRVVRTQGQGQGALRELGQIRFVQGEPVTALLGETTGGAALNALANWGECDYAFDTSADQDTESDPTLGSIGVAGGYPSSPAMSPTSSPSISSSWPSSYGYLNVAPNPQAPSQPLAPNTPRPRTPSFPPLPQGPNSGASYAPDDYPPDSGSLPGYRGPGAPGASPYPGGSDRSRGGQGYSQPLANLPNLPNLNYPGYPPDPGGSRSHYPPSRGGPPSPPRTPSPPPSAPSYAPSSTYNMQPETLAVVPYRTPMATSIEQLPLDRRERMVLLLIDGQRSISDLIRLTRRSEQELYAVLNHLRLLGLLAM